MREHFNDFHLWLEGIDSCRRVEQRRKRCAFCKCPVRRDRCCKNILSFIAYTYLMVLLFAECAEKWSLEYCSKSCLFPLMLSIVVCRPNKRETTIVFLQKKLHAVVLVVTTAGGLIALQRFCDRSSLVSCNSAIVLGEGKQAPW